MKVLGISGSPRKRATDYAVRTALGFMADRYNLATEYFSVRGKKIQFCLHCNYCLRKQQGCVHNDDLLELYPLMEEADIWILGSPVYHGHIAAQLKAVLDRTRALLVKDKHILANKLGCGIAVGGDRNGGQEKVLQTIMDFFLINEMLPVGGGVFGANFGGTVWSQDQGDQGVKEDEQGLKSIRKTCRRLMTIADQFAQR
ncbi:MAG TPA: flavodoxin family protein [Desulfohalobiaceae bacterium]|nr:flavodoxin family protein [Desulfohalobiaceae bacterium]